MRPLSLSIFGPAATEVTLPSEMSVRDSVAAAELEMLKQPQVDLPVRHYFAGGVYARELFIPAGVQLTGAIHKTEHLCVMSAGDMSVLTPEGVKRVQAPFTIISPPGTKRIAFAHAHTVWVTFHATTETDIEKLETMLVSTSEADYVEFLQRSQKELTACHL